MSTSGGGNVNNVEFGRAAESLTNEEDCICIEGLGPCKLWTNGRDCVKDCGSGRRGGCKAAVAAAAADDDDENVVVVCVCTLERIGCTWVTAEAKMIGFVTEVDKEVSDTGGIIADGLV